MDVLDDGQLSELERQAVELAWGAGNILLEHYQGTLEVEYKDKERERDPVTQADRRAEAYLTEEIQRRFPGHGIVGEEGAGEGTEAAELTWVLDPLDGTTNFLNGLPVFASSIALLQRGAPVVAAVFLPWPGAQGGRVLHAHRGGGSFDGQRPLRVFRAERPLSGRLVSVPAGLGWAFRLRRPLRDRPGEPRVGGSIAYELALVADGVYQYGLFGAPHAWDVAAGILLVQEAGGAVLTRRRGRRGWQPFATFAATEGSPPLGQKELREWQAPLLAGDAALTQFVADHLQPRRRPWLRLLRRLRGLFHRPSSEGQRGSQPRSRSEPPP